VSDADEFARSCAQELRATAARYPNDPEVGTLVAKLRTGSEEFARLWASHEVSAPASLRKTLLHPLVAVRQCREECGGDE